MSIALSLLPVPSSMIATDGELSCSVLLKVLTLPENIASVPGRSTFDQWYWLKKVQVNCRELSPMTTLVMCLTPRPLPRFPARAYPRSRSVTFTTFAHTVARSPTISDPRSVSLPRWSYLRG